MRRNNSISALLLASFLLWTTGCQLFKAPLRQANLPVPNEYRGATADSGSSARIHWDQYFSDPYLAGLIDTALRNNRELQLMLQEIEVAKNEAKARKAEYLPFVHMTAAMGADHSGKFTFNGMAEEDLKANPGNRRYIGDFNLSPVFSWELDIWKKLRNARQAAILRYLATADGRNFMVTQLVAEIANAYYELLALDKQLEIINRNIGVQENALNLVKQLKDAGRTNQLAVNRFDAQLLNTMNLQYEIRQKITETENTINLLSGRFPAPVPRSSDTYFTALADSVQTGVPSELLRFRPDIMQAEHGLEAANLDVQVAKASFYPNVRLSASIGLQAFNPAVWFKPESALFSLFGDLVAPLINQNALRANYSTSRAKQVQAVLTYEQTILKAFSEVQNQLAGIENYSKSVDVKSKEVDILSQSVNISESLFRYARADYIEVLLTQREALDSRMELTEIRLNQLKAKVNMYKALGGGWN